MSYDYRENVKNDCIDAIREWLDYHKDDVEGMSRDDLREKLYDALWIEDSVTGNASGSYTFSAYEAEQNIAGNWDLLGEAMREFGCECDAIEKGDRVEMDDDQNARDFVWALSKFERVQLWKKDGKIFMAVGRIDDGKLLLLNSGVNARFVNAEDDVCTVGYAYDMAV